MRRYLIALFVLLAMPALAADNGPGPTFKSVVVGSPTGGNQGTGTVNATGYYVNGVPFSGGGCTSNCTFTGTTTTGAIAASGAINTTAGYQMGGSTIYNQSTSGLALALGVGAGTSMPSNNNFDVYVGNNAGNAQTMLNGELTLVGSGVCRFCVSANGTTAMGTAALYLETASGANNVFGFAGGENETCIGADTCRNQVESSYISAVGRRAVAYGNVNNVQAMGYQAFAGNSGAIVITGTPTAGANVTFRFTGTFTGSPVDIPVTIPAAPTTYTVANAIANAIYTAGSGAGSLVAAAVSADQSGVCVTPAAACVRISAQGTSTVGPQKVVVTVASQTDTATYTIGGGLSANNIVAIGDYALFAPAATNPTNLIGIGTGAAKWVTTGANSTFIGPSIAPKFSTGSNVYFVGGITSDVFSGGTSNAVGVGNGVVLGTNDVCIGSTACAATGADSLGRVAIGNGAGSSNTTGTSLTAVGQNAAQFYSTGSRGTFVGQAAGRGVTGTRTTGNNNSGFGDGALTTLQGAGANNSAFGQGSAGACTTCSQVSAFGQGAASKVTTGAKILALGQNTGPTNMATGTNVILIGSGNSAVDTPGASTSNMINIENTIAGTLSGGTKPRICAAGVQCVLGVLSGADFNSTADQAVVIDARTSTLAGYISSVSKYIITAIEVDNCSAALTTAQGGFYTGTLKTGTIIGATTTPFTACTSATTMQMLKGVTNMDTNTFTVGTIYLSLTTAQGGAATGDVRIIGIPIN